MNKDFNALKPEALWRHFVNIMATPHPSHHEDGIKAYIKDFATTNNLDCISDEAGNILIRKGASAGMESRQVVVLQAHMDMVPQKNDDKEFDFTKDPIEGYIDGDWVRANGTTLGADNGVGMAAMLAVLEDDTLQHGAIEALFTSDEECGMDGVFGMKPDLLTGDILLNLDTEDEDELCVGCAGGLDLVATFDYESESTPQGDYVARRLSVKGLRGGHSGCQIHEQRGNANKLLFRFLRLTKFDLLLCAVNGGTLRNAIPREAYADILVHTDDLSTLEEQVASYCETITKEYSTIEDELEVTLTPIDYPETMMDETSAACLVWAMAGCPNGVYSMSYTVPGLVQTSSNLSIVRSNGSQTKVEMLLRSSCDSEKIALADTIASVFELADAEVVADGGYPGWMPNMDSEILGTLKAGHTEVFGGEPHVRGVHAGLECALIGSLYPKMDMVSFGPTIMSPHSPDECVQISSVERFYTLLLYALANIPAKE